MDITLRPGKLTGQIEAISSKSMAHRLLICAAFAHRPTTLVCSNTGEDVAATCQCLNALGAHIRKTDHGYQIHPLRDVPTSAIFPCGESGSTLRFLLPIAGALGINATFELKGRLPHRPLSPLWEEMERMGCTLSRPTEDTIHCTGKLRLGHYQMNGGVSSQFISGLMMALPLIDGESDLEITGSIESKPYIDMTRQVLQFFNGDFPGQIVVEGDWSNAAFWLAANALGSEIGITGLSDASPQGDKIIADLLPKLRKHAAIFAADIPDLVPILSVVAAVNRGAVFTNIRRLRLKESDRVASTIAMIENLGGQAQATEDTLTIYGTGLRGGIVDSCGDHRIAMSGAIASLVCPEPVTILNAECVKKSYPGFWEDFSYLGGTYGKNLR